MAINRVYRIRVGSRLVEVSREVYITFYSMARRERYLEERDTKHGKTLYNQLDNGDITGEDMIPDRDSVFPEDVVLNRIMAVRLRECLRLLTESELALIVKRYYEDRSQRDVAAELGVNQSSVCRREERILAKLRNMLGK